MTPLPPRLPAEPFSDEERGFADRLSKLDAPAGPSAALDARVLAAASAAALPTSRRTRRWPGALGAAAVLVAAVGMAWQLRPMFELPPPAVERAGGPGASGANSETVVQIENVRRALPPVATTGDTAARSAAPAAVRKAASVAGGGPRSKPLTPAARRLHAHPHSPEFVDEALPAADSASIAREVAAPPAAPVAAAAPARDEPPMAAQMKSAAQSNAHSATASIDIEADTRLSLRAWLARIRERRDAGDIAGARASLDRFVVAHPRLRVPADLRPLLRGRDPWSP